MNEFKFHINRSFNTEQFSFTATIKSDKTVLDQEDITAQLSSISNAIHSQFQEVIAREIKEKELVAQNLEARVNANTVMGEATKKLYLASSLESYSLDDVTKALNSLADNDTIDNTVVPVDVPVTPEPVAEVVTEPVITENNG